MRSRRLTSRLAVAILAVLVLAGCFSDPRERDDGRLSTSGDADAAVEVTIPTDDLDLAGALYLPSGEGPHPGVVIAHGSGPNDRRGQFIGQLGLSFPRPVPVYEQLAEGLRERGYAVLTWDKRTCGPFNDCGDNDYPPPADDLTIDVLVDDVAAAVELLDRRDDIGEVAVIGHSKGGTMALDLPSHDVEVAALVLAATPSAPIDQVLVGQADTLAELLRMAGHDSDAAQAQVASLRVLADDVAALRGGLDPNADPHDDVAGASLAFWQSWVGLSDRSGALLEAFPAPVLVLGGEHDWNVPPEQIEAWEPHLRDVDDLVILDEVTHALTWLGEADVSAFTLDDLGLEVEPAVVDTIADWLDTVLAHP